MKQKGAFFAVVLLALSFGLPAAEVYKWVDKEGRVTYHERPPLSDEYKIEKKIVSDSVMSDEDQARRLAAKSHPVVLYSIKKCDTCDLARRYLQRRNVPFTEKSVENDRELQKEVLAKTGSLTVPVITIGDKIMNGYMESLLEGELNGAGYPRMRKQEPPVEENGPERKEEEQQVEGRREDS